MIKGELINLILNHRFSNVENGQKMNFLQFKRYNINRNQVCAIFDYALDFKCLQNQSNKNFDHYHIWNMSAEVKTAEGAAERAAMFSSVGKSL